MYQLISLLQIFFQKMNENLLFLIFFYFNYHYYIFINYLNICDVLVILGFYLIKSHLIKYSMMTSNLKEHLIKFEHFN